MPMKDNLMSTFEMHCTDWLTVEDMEVRKHSSKGIITIQSVKPYNSAASAKQLL